MTDPPDEQPDVVRGVEIYTSTVQVAAAIILRVAAGWTALSAGRIDDTQFWVEFERGADGTGVKDGHQQG